MSDTEPQTAKEKVLWHFLMSLDGFVAGPNHEMDWMTGSTVRFGDGATREVGTDFADLGCRRVLAFIDPAVRAHYPGEAAVDDVRDPRPVSSTLQGSPPRWAQACGFEIGSETFSGAVPEPV